MHLNNAAMTESPGTVNTRLLQEILQQLQQLNQTLDDFTGQGMPLKAQVPDAQLIASIAAATALVAREKPGISTEDLQGRIAAAQVLATELIRAFDAYQSQTRPGRLNQLASGH
jgi:hypothetical protein